MAIIFPELSKTTVHVGIGGGKWIEVPMLSIGQFNEFQRIQAELVAIGEKQGTPTADRVDALITARTKLADLACAVMPPELHNRVRMLDWQELTALVNVLCTGKDDSDKDDPQKKVLLPSQQAKTE